MFFLPVYDITPEEMERRFGLNSRP